MSEQNPLRMVASQVEADALEAAIRAAFSQAESTYNVGAFSYQGPAPGGFGFGEGVLDFIGGAWAELMKVPEAINILAQGIADYLRLKGNKQAIVFSVVDGQIRGSFEATGNAVSSEPDAIAKSLAAAIQQAGVKGK